MAGSVLIGVWLRVGGLSSRPFWRDEAWVAERVAQSGWSDLLRVTDAPVPPLFAAAASLTGRLAAPAELGMRLVPAVAGMGVAALVYPLARLLRAPRVVSGAAASLSAVSLGLVIWSRDLKQYQCEALVSMLMMLLAARVLCRPASTRVAVSETAALLALGLLGPWLGYGSMLPAAAVAGLLMLHRPLHRPRRAAVLAGAAAALGLAASVGLLLRGGPGRQAADQALTDYMSLWYFNPLRPIDWQRAAAGIVNCLSALFVPFDWITSLLARVVVATCVLSLVVIGLLTWPRCTRRAFAWWLITPAVLLLVAAAARRYPFGVVRMMVFLMPPLVMAVAAGVVRLSREAFIAAGGRGATGLVAGWALSLVPLVWVVRVPLANAHWVNHDFPAILRELQTLRRPGEMVLVERLGVTCVRYYTGGGYGFELTPVSAGTLVTPGFDYETWFRRRIERAGPRWWLIRTSEDIDYDLKRVLATSRYRLELKAQIGKPSALGAAQLYLATRD